MANYTKPVPANMFPAVDYGKSISSGLIFCPSFSESFNTLRLFDASQKRAHGTFSGITADKWKMDDKKGVGKILSLRPYISGGGIDITGLSSSSGNYTVAFYAAKDTTDGAFLDVLTGRIALRSSTMPWEYFQTVAGTSLKLTIVGLLISGM